MYDVNKKKRYNVKILQLDNSLRLENVRLLAVDRNFVAVLDDDEKEHIFTGGNIGIYISEYDEEGNDS